MLLEREPELGRLERCLDEAGGGRGALVVVDGPAGVGKTTLVRAATESARARGMGVLPARGAPLERNFAHGVVRQLFEPIIRPGRRRIDGLLAGAAELALPALDPTAGPGSTAGADSTTERTPPRTTGRSRSGTGCTGSPRTWPTGPRCC